MWTGAWRLGGVRRSAVVVVSEVYCHCCNVSVVVEVVVGGCGAVREEVF